MNDQCLEMQWDIYKLHYLSQLQLFMSVFTNNILDCILCGIIYIPESNADSEWLHKNGLSQSKLGLLFETRRILKIKLRMLLRKRK